MCGTDPTQKTCATVDHADYTAPTLLDELDHTDQGPICPEGIIPSTGTNDL